MHVRVLDVITFSNFPWGDLYAAIAGRFLLEYLSPASCASTDREPSDHVLLLVTPIVHGAPDPSAQV